MHVLGCQFSDFFISAARRNQAAAWLRQMNDGASEVLPMEPSEEHFCLSLRNGLILCNVLKKVNPGAIPKVIEIPIIDTDGAAQTAIQYFENMRNFLVAVGQMKLLTFEVSDLEKGGSSGKVVDCILCLKGYYKWRKSGGIGVWKYGGTVRITSFPKGSRSPSSLIGSESADESLDDSESSQFEDLLEFLHLSSEVSLEESKVSTALAFLFDRLGIGLLQAYLSETNELDDFPLNSMVIDIVLRKAVKDLSAVLISQGNQLGLFLKNLLKGNCTPLLKHAFLQAISKYINQRSGLVSDNISNFCICGRKGQGSNISYSPDNTSVIDLQQKQLEELKASYHLIKMELKEAHLTWEQELRKIAHHAKDLEVASSSYHKVLEENRQLYNQVQDLKGAIRVYCRVKPFQSDEQSTVDYIGENGNIMTVNRHKQGKDARKMFTFNKVFGGNTTQEQIYVDTRPLIRSTCLNLCEQCILLIWMPVKRLRTVYHCQ